MVAKNTPAGTARFTSHPAPVNKVKRRVYVVDDHPIVRQGLVQLVDHEPDLEVVGQSDDAYAALREMLAARPDLALLDVSLKDADGLELLKELKAQGAEFPVLVLSMHDESLYAERALRAGARGYVQKQEPPEVLLGAIRRVLAGENYVSARMSATLIKRMVGGKGPQEATSPMERLTDRELEVFRLIGGGQTVREIAERLCLSIKTSEAHREHIKEKLSLKTSAELLRFAIRNTPDAN
jgi:DNA-binding NarL/FixJ family response regulator